MRLIADEGNTEVVVVNDTTGETVTIQAGIENDLDGLTNSGVVISAIGIIIGIFALVILFSAVTRVGGQVGTGMRLALVGALLQVSAYISNLLVHQAWFEDTVSLPFGLNGHDIFSLLMALGMLFFVLAAYNFSRVAQK